MGVLLVTGILKEITCLQAVADDEACKYGYESWIAYCYKTNIFTRFITICPCCKNHLLMTTLLLVGMYLLNMDD